MSKIEITGSTIVVQLSGLHAPLDVCIWGYLKDKAYCIPPNTIELEPVVGKGIEEMPKYSRMPLVHQCKTYINNKDGILEL